jgi:hypothetical protein
MKYLLSFLFCLSASAQLPVIPYMLPSAASVFYPTNLPGTWVAWWVASDNPTNITITNWVDRVKGESLTNTLALSPTNSATGMGLTGSTYLKLKHYIVPAGNNTQDTNMLFMVIVPITPSTDFSGLWGGDDTTLYTGGRLLFVRTTSKYHFNSTSALDLGAAWPSGVMTDIVLMGAKANTGITLWTNGISSFASAQDGFSQADSLLGWNPNNSGGFKGKVVEILRGSNIPPVSVSLIVSNLHWYATNTYHYAP